MQIGECDRLRQEILQLLHVQIEILNKATSLTDVELLSCYQRHEQVHELRGQLLAKLDSATEKAEVISYPDSAAITSVAGALPGAHTSAGM
jgi:hypothetical protein